MANYVNFCFSWTRDKDRPFQLWVAWGEKWSNIAMIKVTWNDTLQQKHTHIVHILL